MSAYGLLDDMRQAARSLIRRPAFTAAALTSLGLAIGAGTTILGVAKGLLLRQVPGVTRTERLVEIREREGNDFFDLSWPMIERLRAQDAVLEDVAAFAMVPVSVTTGGEPIVAGGLAITGNYLSLFGLSPAQGRGFGPGEADYPGVAPVVLVSDFFARTHLGGEAAVGRQVRVNGTSVEIIGVMPEGFAGHSVGLLADVFVPLGLPVAGLPGPGGMSEVANAGLEALGRLAPGVSLSGAAAALATAGDQLLRERGQPAEARFTPALAPWGSLPAIVRGPAQAFLAVLLGLVALAIAMGGINLTSMLLARAAEQHRELAVRRAIGASTFRLGRQVVVESTLLFLAAGLVGVLVAAWTSGLARGLRLPIPIPGRLDLDFPVDGAVLGAALVACLTGGLLFGLVPALWAGRFPLLQALKVGNAATAAGRSRLRSALIGGQVAFTTLLLVAALLFGRALGRAELMQAGWSTDDVLIASIDLTLDGTDPAAGAAFHAALLERGALLPGVTSVALAAKLPLGGRSSFGLVTAPGVTPPSGQPGHDAALNRVSAGYFRTMGIPLVRGRDIAPTDVAGAANVAVINQTMAARLWPGQEAVGRRFSAGTGPYARDFEIIGVAADVGFAGAETGNFYYVASAQWYNAEQILHLKIDRGAAAAVTADLRRLIRQIDADVPIPAVRPMEEALAVFLLPQRLASAAAGALGLFGLLLAMVGVAGITAFMASRRTRELGIRMALGATRERMMTMMVRQVGLAPGVGLVVGLVMGAVFSAGAALAVPGVTPGDPVALLLAPGLIALATLGAIVMPVRRVLRRNPLAALREE